MSAKNVALLDRRVEKVLPGKEGFKKLLSKKKIRVYQGFDPTGGKLHLGHSVGIRKLMEFANAGHKVIFLFGTGTVLVGDPSERSTGRKLITQKEIDENIRTWKEQVAPLVDFDKVEVRNNGDWLNKLKLKDIINIASKISAVQLFKRKMFQKRLDQGDTVWYHETMYPLLQGYDSVVLDVDLEIGGTDQEFNMLIGRELQKKMNKREKFVLTTPMILGTDGKQMSKTSGNCVWLDDKPNDMFRKLMKILDNQIIPYYKLVTNTDSKVINDIKKQLKKGESPLTIKRRLAYTVVKELHSDADAQLAQEYFDKNYRGKGKTEYDTSWSFVSGGTITDVASDYLPSRTVAKSHLKQGAINVNEKVVKDPTLKIHIGDKIKIGTKVFVKVIDKE